MEFIDSHTHLNDDAYTEGGAAMVEKAITAGVTRMILPGTRLAELPDMKRLQAQYPDKIKMFAGVHPTEIGDLESSMAAVEAELAANKGEYVGVGEIGIDLYEENPDIAKQKEAFRRQCLMALKYGLPINIHCREGLKETLEVLDSLPAVPKGAFHCFGGSVDDVRAIRHTGDFYFGINGIVTFKNSGLREVLPEIGIERIILETDAPYLTPTPFRGKRNDSSFIPLIAEQIAQTLGIPLEDVARITTANTRSLYPGI